MASWNEKLLTASEKGNIKEVELCIKNRANLECRDGILRRTPLLNAAQEGHLEVVTYLVTHGSQLEVTDWLRRTPLMNAAQEGHLEVVTFLVTHGSQLEATDQRGWTPLMLAAGRGHLEVVTFLVTHRSQLEATSTSGYTALHYAAENGRIDVTKWLIHQGCSPWVKSKQAEINRVVKDNKFNSTSDKGFESAVTCIVSFLSGLQHTPTTRDKVKQRVKKRIYNQQSYQKTKQIAEANGVSVKKCQSIAVKRNLTYPIETPPTNTKQPRKYSPVHSSPVLSSPDRSSPVRSSPVRSSPDRSSPVRSSPVRSSPDRASPVRSSPDPASPVSPSAVRSSPVHSSSVNLSAVRSSPVNSSPVNSSSSRSSPGQPVTLSSPEAVGSPETTKSLNPQDIISSPASTSSSVTTRVKVFKNSSGVTFHIQDTVCIARGKNSCDYAKVTSVWNTKVDITYLKKTAKGLKTWIVSHDKPYTDSVHINTIFFSFGKAEWSSDIHCTIKDKLAKLFE